MFKVEGSRFKVQGLGFRVQGAGFRVHGLGLRVQGLGSRVQGLGSFRGWAPLGVGLLQRVGSAPWVVSTGRDHSPMDNVCTPPTLMTKSCKELDQIGQGI